MSDRLWLALALVLVLEGIVPFAWPALWRQTMLRLARLNNRQIRIIGLASMLVGLLMVLFLQ